MQQVYLTRRNLLTLLNKLAASKVDKSVSTSILKRDNTHPVYPQSDTEIFVTALEDEEYYTHRDAGHVEHAPK